MDLDTFSLIEKHGPEDEIWLKVTLDQIRCVKQVLRFKGNGVSYQTWTCSGDHCNSCRGKRCEEFVLTISIEEAGAASDLPSFSDCKHGNIVKFERIGGDDKMKVVEIAVIEMQGMIYDFSSLFFRPENVLQKCRT